MSLDFLYCGGTISASLRVWHLVLVLRDVLCGVCVVCCVMLWCGVLCCVALCCVLRVGMLCVVCLIDKVILVVLCCDAMRLL